MFNMAVHSASSLTNRHDRAVARLAMRANLDTINGGCRALTLAHRMDNIAGPGSDWESIVSDVYSASLGRVPDQYLPCECPNCGQVHLGAESAQMCCSA